jgi:hypothetical protein
MSSNKKIDELGIGDNSCWAIVFGYPLHDIGTNIHELKKGIVIIYVLIRT